jgi:predicted unusual protein kinase regulating ubiquinone biosynthesis (AarF/ABC1/UbiB family)
MNEIPSNKVQRTSRFVKTGLEVGGNYLKHYAKKLVGAETSQHNLDKENAESIYNGLSELKGSALKMAQMLSMDQGLLPREYTSKFAEAQYQAPALSAPLVVKTFRQYFGKSPLEIFDTFDAKAIHAASMGQVHKATKNQVDFAVKIQYPGVGDSVTADMNMVKPVAKRLFGWKDSDFQAYFEEVRARLLEETDYELEVRRGTEIAEKCKVVENIRIPKYYPEYSNHRVITMEWMDGFHIDKWLEMNPSQEDKNKAAQAMWDFYHFQIHDLRMMHADAHPGNFLFQPDGTLIVLDFGCIKEIPEDFYEGYYELLKEGVTENDAYFRELCFKMGALLGNETPEEEAFFLPVYKDAIRMLCKPFQQDTFDFGNKEYFADLYRYGEEMMHQPEVRKSKPRGSHHGLYFNRMHFGLFHLLHQLNATVETKRFVPKVLNMNS